MIAKQQTKQRFFQLYTFTSPASSFTTIQVLDEERDNYFQLRRVASAQPFPVDASCQTAALVSMRVNVCVLAIHFGTPGSGRAAQTSSAHHNRDVAEVDFETMSNNC